MLALLLLASLASEPEVRLSYPRALVWAALPAAADQWSTGYALSHGAREWNVLGGNPDQRAALKLAGSVLAASAFHALENHPQRKSKAWRLPRYLWAAGHVIVAVHNLRAARR